MYHIYNVSAILEKMQDKPRAQRIQEWFNKDMSARLTFDQKQEIQSILDEEHEKISTRILNEIF